MNVDLDIQCHVALVTINRPDVLNALDTEAIDVLEAIWQRLEADANIHAIVLTGVGERAFCAGADMRAAGKTGLEYWARAHPSGLGALSLRTTLDIPIIARVNGPALGGGLQMMLGCDIVVAVESATFGLQEPRVGRLPLDGGHGTAATPDRLPRGDGNRAPHHRRRGRGFRAGE